TTGAIIRLAVVFLLVANLVAAYLVIRPIGGSPQELRTQLGEMRTQLRQRQGSLERTKKLVQKIEAGRGGRGNILEEYFLPRRTAYAQVIAELTRNAVESKIRPKESSYALEPVEGSDTLSMMQVSASYEGGYRDLIRFINSIDRSENLLIIEGLNA